MRCIGVFYSKPFENFIAPHTTEYRYSKKKEVCPDGSTDQNVFDIQQGVAIGFFIKYQNSDNKLATIYHEDLYGLREIREDSKIIAGKYAWLLDNLINTTNLKSQVIYQ